VPVLGTVVVVVLEQLKTSLSAMQPQLLLQLWLQPYQWVAMYLAKIQVQQK